MSRASRNTAPSGDSPRTLRKKSQGNSLESASERFQTRAPHKCPFPLTKQEQSIYEQILKSREFEFWSPNDIRLAGILAQNYRRLLDVDKELEDTGYTYDDADGVPHAHPLVAIQGKLTIQIKSLTNTLGMSASTRGLTSPNQKKRNAAGVKTQELMDRLEAEEDNLI